MLNEKQLIELIKSDERLKDIKPEENGYVHEIKPCPDWMKPYEVMLIIWAGHYKDQPFIFHALPYRTDIGKFKYEIDYEEEKIKRKGIS